jgi:exodeoxyribonuclease VII large subunit
LFDDERVVRAIADCAIPVLTGIGHQRDESLADLVADASAHTPTAAAELAVPELAHLYTEHQQRQRALHDAVTQVLQASHSRLQRLKTDYDGYPLTDNYGKNKKRSHRNVSN